MLDIFSKNKQRLQQANQTIEALEQRISLLESELQAQTEKYNASAV